jgi:hypothetical protein
MKLVDWLVATLPLLVYVGCMFLCDRLGTARRRSRAGKTTPVDGQLRVPRLVIEHPNVEASLDTSTEGPLVAGLLAGTLSPLAYRRAMERLAADDDAGHPVDIPSE